MHLIDPTSKPTDPTVKKRKPIRRPPRLIKAKAIKGNVEMSGTLELVAGQGEGENKTEAKLRLVANTGKPMMLAGFDHPVVVDLAGAAFDKRLTPIIADHNTSKRVGHTVEQVIVKAGQKGTFGGKTVHGPFIGAVGVRSSEMEVAKGIMADAKAGFPFQVSIGATIKKGYILAEGETADINGQAMDGPLIVAQKSAIRELSVLVLGADNDTSAIVAAKPKENDMEFEAWVESLGFVVADLTDAQRTSLQAQHDKLNQEPPPLKKKAKRKPAKVLAGGGDDPDDDDDDGEDEPPRRTSKNRIKANLREIQNEEAAENAERIESINEIIARFSTVEVVEFQEEGKSKPTKMTLKSFKAHAIRNDMSPSMVELHLHRSNLPDLSAGGPSIHMVDKDVTSEAVEVNILMANGIPVSAKNEKTGREYGLDQYYDAKVLEASHLKQHRVGNSINKLLSLQAAAGGKRVSHMTSPADLMQAAWEAWNNIKAFSGSSGIKITNLLENVMYKSGLAGFEGVEGVWRQIAATTTLNDFRPHNMYRLDWNGHFRKVPTDGELKHVGMTDTKYSLQAETYGAMIAVDRKTQINDDMGMIVQKARSLGMLGALRIEEAVFVLLLANTGSFFAAGNGNLITGAGTALSIASLETATTNFANLVINDKPISISPSRLLVGTNQTVNATRLFTLTDMALAPASTPAFANNPFAGRFRPIVSGYLNNTSIKDQDGNAITGQSATQWFLFPDPNAPQGAALMVGFLNGRQTPFFEEGESQFNVPGGLQFRAYFDWGVAFGVEQMALKSAGA